MRQMHQRESFIQTQYMFLHSGKRATQALYMFLHSGETFIQMLYFFIRSGKVHTNWVHVHILKRKVHTNLLHVRTFKRKIHTNYMFIHSSELSPYYTSIHSIWIVRNVNASHTLDTLWSIYFNDYFLAFMVHDVDGLMQERHNSIANAMELRLSCTNPSMCVR